MYLSEKNLPEAAKFVTGGLWQDMKRALMERRPAAPLSAESPSTAAQQFFLRQGFEEALIQIEKMAREIDPASIPVVRPAFLDERD